MKRYKQSLLTLAMLANLVCMDAFAAQDNASIRVLSFNMHGRGHVYQPMQKNYTKFLKENYLEVDSNTPDFIATQENYQSTHRDFISALNLMKPAAKFVQYGRKQGGLNSITTEETSAIIYNSARWLLIPQVAEIQNKLHLLYDNCDKYVNKDNLTCTFSNGSSMMTWGIFKEKSNPTNIVIFTSTQQSKDQQNRAKEQKDLATITDRLANEVSLLNLLPNSKLTVVMAGDYSTYDFTELHSNLCSYIKGGKNAPWSYLEHPDVIFSNTQNSNLINYRPGDWITDHGPIAETVLLNQTPIPI